MGIPWPADPIMSYLGTLCDRGRFELRDGVVVIVDKHNQTLPIPTRVLARMERLGWIAFPEEADVAVVTDKGRSQFRMWWDEKNPGREFVGARIG